MPSITKALIFLLANYSVHYTSAANCGLVMRERPDRPGNAETKGTRKEKLPVNTENLPPGCDEGDSIDIELPNGKMKTFKRPHGLLRNSSNKLFRGES